MVHEVSRRSFNSEAVFDTMPDHTRIVVVKVAIGQIFLRIIRYFLSISFHIFSILIIVYMFLLPEKTNGRTLGNFSEKQLSYRNRGKLNRKVLPFFSALSLFILFNKRTVTCKSLIT